MIALYSTFEWQWFEDQWFLWTVIVVEQLLQGKTVYFMKPVLPSTPQYKHHLLMMFASSEMLSCTAINTFRSDFRNIAMKAGSFVASPVTWHKHHGTSGEVLAIYFESTVPKKNWRLFFLKNGPVRVHSSVPVGPQILQTPLVALFPIACLVSVLLLGVPALPSATVSAVRVSIAFPADALQISVWTTLQTWVTSLRWLVRNGFTACIILPRMIHRNPDVLSPQPGRLYLFSPPSSSGHLPPSPLRNSAPIINSRSWFQPWQLDSSGNKNITCWVLH